MYGMTTERGFLEEKKFKIKSRGASVSKDVLKGRDPLSLRLVTEQMKHGQIWGLVLPPGDYASEDMTLSVPHVQVWSNSIHGEAVTVERGMLETYIL